MTTRDDYVFRAKLAQKTNRFDIMTESMKMAVMIDAKLTEEERDLLSDSYKNAIEDRRFTLETITSLQRKLEFRHHENRIEMAKSFLIQVEQEIRDVCREILGLLDQYLIPASFNSVFSTAFYFKMKGDYYKCLSEFSSGKERNRLIERSRISYMASSNSLWSELKCDIDLLAQLYDWDDNFQEDSQSFKDLSKTFGGAQSYLRLWLIDGELSNKKYVDERKRWKSADFVLTL